MLRRMGPPEGVPAILMDRAYEGDATRQDVLAAQLGYTPVVPPKKNRTHPWEYDKTLYRKTLYRKTLYRKTLYRKTLYRKTLYRKTLYRKTLYRKTLYRRRNEVERLFRRLKGFRRVFTRYDKLDALYLGFILFAIIFDALRSVNTR